MGRKFVPLDKAGMKEDVKEAERSQGQDFQYWKAKEGKNSIRIVRNPDDPQVYRKAYVHFQVGPFKKFTVTCLRTFGKKCPICEEVKQNPDNADLQNSKVKTRYYFNMIDLEESDIVQVLSCGGTIASPIIALLNDEKEDDMTHPTEGFNLTIQRKGLDRSTKYVVIPERKSSKVPNEDIYDYVYDLDVLVYERTEEEIEAILRGDDISERVVETQEEGKEEKGKEAKKEEVKTEEKKEEVKTEVKKEGTESDYTKFDCFGKKELYDENDIECKQCSGKGKCVDAIGGTSKKSKKGVEFSK